MFNVSITGTWTFTPDAALADGTHTYKVVVTDDAGNSAVTSLSLEIDATAPVIDTLNIVDGINEGLTYIGQVTATDAAGNGVTFSVADTNFVIDPNTGALSYALDANGHPILSDYEDATSATVTVKATDSLGNESTKDVTFNVNNIAGTVTAASSGELVSQSFSHGDNEGWTGGSDYSWNRLGDFGKDTITQAHDFDLSSNAGENVTIAFKLGTHGSWEGNDNFVVNVYDSANNLIETNVFSPDENTGWHNYNDYSFSIEVPGDGQISVTMSSENTQNWVELWSIDNFTITGEAGEVLSFDSSNEGTIDLSAVLAQGNDFGTPDEVSKIDLTNGKDNVLANITLKDVISMTDGDNELIITGDASDTVELDSTVWKQTTPTSSVYTNIAADGTTAAETVMITIEDVIVDI